MTRAEALLLRLLKEDKQPRISEEEFCAAQATIRQFLLSDGTDAALYRQTLSAERKISQYVKQEQRDIFSKMDAKRRLSVLRNARKVVREMGLLKLAESKPARRGRARATESQ